MNTSTQTGRESVPDPQQIRPDQPSLVASTEKGPVAEAPIGTETHEGRPEGEILATEVAPKQRRPRGFAAMDRSLVSAIARKGGKAAHEAGTAHEFTREEAREAGRKGGQATHAKRRAKTEGQA